MTKNISKVLFVCLGNICRSPLAEGVFLNLVSQKGLANKYLASSAGTAGYHIGALPDKRSRDVAVMNGFELTSTACRLAKEDFEKFDYIIAMDRANLADIKALAGNNPLWQEKILLMRDFDPLAKGKEVPDPYYDGPEKFEEVYHMLVKANDGLIDWLEARC